MVTLKLIAIAIYVLKLIAIAIYVLIGFYVSFTYWDDTKKGLEENGVEEDKGMVNIILMLVTIFWPIKLTYSFLKKKKILK